MTLARQLVEWAYRLNLGEVPEDVHHRSRLLLADAVGLALAAASEDFARVVAGVVRNQAPGSEATLLGMGERASASGAALVNGTLVHGLDFDDSHAGSIVHTTASVVPAVLAAGEATGASGAQALRATIIGLEVAARVGLGAAGEFHRRGFHITSLAGTFAAALASSVLFRLSGEQAVHALGIAGSQASGLREAYLGGEGTWTKRLHPGWAAHAGVMAALLARKGFTGPSTVFEGRFGFYPAHVGDAFDVARVTRTLGHGWEIRQIGFKAYPCGIVIHAFLDSLKYLMRQHAFGFRDVERVVCHIHPEARQTVCLPREEKLRPQNGYHAKFSLPFCAALLLVDGDVRLESFSDQRLQDPLLSALAERVHDVDDPQSPYPATYPGWVEVFLKDGTRLEHRTPHPRGSLENPMDEEDVRNKFMACATRILAAEQAATLFDAILAIHREPDLKRLVAPTPVGQVRDPG